MQENKKKTILVLALLVVVGLGIYTFTKAKKGPEEGPSVEPTPAIPTPKIVVDIGKAQEEVQKTRRGATLTDVSGGGSTGQANISFDGTKYIVAMSASLPTPTGGKFYEGWIMSDSATPNALSAGRMGALEKNQFATGVRDE